VSLGTHSVNAACPSGKTLLGTGYAVSAPGGNTVVVDDFEANGSTSFIPTSVTVNAYEAEASTEDWLIVAYAICAGSVGDQLQTSVVSANDPNSPKALGVACPSGMVMTGVGFAMTGANGRAVVNDLRPNGSSATAPTAAVVTAYERQPLGTNWRLISSAICADR
jgi:hypothetical protein